MKNKFIEFLFIKIDISYKKIFQFINNIKKMNIKNFLIYLKFLNNKISKIIYKNFISCLKNLYYINKIIIIKDFKIITSKGVTFKKIFYKAKGNYSFIRKNFTNLLIKFYV